MEAEEANEGEEEEEPEEPEPPVTRYALDARWVEGFRHSYADPANTTKRYLSDWPYTDGMYTRLLPGQECPDDAIEVVFRCPQPLASLAWPEVLRVFDPLACMEESGSVEEVEVEEEVEGEMEDSLEM